MNLLNGELHGDRLAIGPAILSLNGFAPVSGTVTVGIRAEDLRVAQPGEEALPFRIDYVEELGSQRLVHGLLGDQALTAAFAPDVALPDELSLSIAPDRLHFFSTETGKRIASPQDGLVRTGQKVLSGVN
jgi:sn-glycerol 3-phosphate transport system ATP-binding protein